MRVVLSGSAGFIGGHLAQVLLAQGHEVYGLDNYLSGQPQTTAQLRRWPGFHFTEADITRGWPAPPGPLDWVLHLASPASPAQYLRWPVETLMAGAQGTQGGLDLALERGAQFLLASTSEVYGDPLVHPQPESYRGNVGTTGPRACYNEAKRYAEALTLTYHRARGLPCRVARIFNTYGPGMHPDDGRVLTTFVRQALAGQPLSVAGDGSQTRSFQYADDLIEGLLRLMRANYAEPVNLGSAEEVTVLDLARRVLEATGSAAGLQFVPLPTDDPQRRQPDLGLARAVLDWSPRISLAEGLRRTVESVRASLETP